MYMTVRSVPDCGITNELNVSDILNLCVGMTSLDSEPGVQFWMGDARDALFGDGRPYLRGAG